MALNEQQLQKVQDWMNSKKISTKCPACGLSTAREIGDIISAPIMKGNNISIGGPSIPMIQISCKNCAHIMLLAAVPIGILK